jgi:diaminohydroxyphosphoribosylaminopyrimidine deaminase/5-amino-6-(5-phosphoribosylamino)uracil reductase
MIYRAPILIGEGRDAIEGFDVNTLADAHGRWRVVDTRMLGIDSLAVYERVRD